MYVLSLRPAALMGCEVRPAGTEAAILPRLALGLAAPLAPVVAPPGPPGRQGRACVDPPGASRPRDSRRLRSFPPESRLVEAGGDSSHWQGAVTNPPASDDERAAREARRRSKRQRCWCGRCVRPLPPWTASPYGIGHQLWGANEGRREESGTAHLWQIGTSAPSAAARLPAVQLRQYLRPPERQWGGGEGALKNNARYTDRPVWERWLCKHTACSGGEEKGPTCRAGTSRSVGRWWWGSSRPGPQGLPPSVACSRRRPGGTALARWRRMRKLHCWRKTPRGGVVGSSDPSLGPQPLDPLRSECQDAVAWRQGAGWRVWARWEAGARAGVGTLRCLCSVGGVGR